MRVYLTSDIEGTGGIIKETTEDFRVTEIPLYLPSGEGEHSYLLLEKQGITTLEAIRRIARELAISDRDIGYAGMKDAVGITRQTISIPRVEPERLLALELPGIVPLTAKRHRNKLKLGHSAGNTFRILVRGVADDALNRATAVIDLLSKRGVPNFFGPQRYGVQGNSHFIGLAWLAGDYQRALDTLIGVPDAVRDERWRSAIEAYRNGDLEASARLFPGHCRTERDIVSRLIKRPGEWERALAAVHPRLKMLYFSAVQSALFDRVLAKRLDFFDTVMVGDIACKHENGACFVVEDLLTDAERAENFDISATGPMFGSRMKMPTGRAREIEEEVLSESGIGPESFAGTKDWRYEGERRPLRVPLGNPSAAAAVDGLLLEFSLPRGSYATTLLREIMKTGEW